MSFPLRPYQARAVAEARDVYRRGSRAILLVAPTGAGKTRIGVEFVSTAARRGGGVLWLAHREELLRQARERLLAEGVDDVGIVAPWAPASDAAVQVASVQTLVARQRRGVALPPARVVVLDEAHHHVADTYAAIADHYRASVRLGLTATPERADGRPLGDLFDTLIPVSSIAELTALGVLVPCVTYAPAGATRELSRDPVAAYMGLGTTARAFVFAANVAHAEQVAASFNAEGVPAATVHAGTSWRLRTARLEAFRTGDPAPLRARGIASPEPAPRVLVNVYTLTEGVDVPEAEVCILARGCGSAGMYLQMVGRVLRCAPGKTGATLLDLRGAVHKHGLPETERVSSLTRQPIATAGEAAPRVVACAQCGAVFGAWASGLAGQRVCPQCGADAPAPVMPRVTARELYRMGPAAAPETKARSLRDLCDRAAARGYKAGWVAHLYRLRFAEWPGRGELAAGMRDAGARAAQSGAV